MTLAIFGGPPVRTQPFPRWPVRGKAEEAALQAALTEGDWGGYPLPNVWTRRFSEAFAKRHDSKHTLCVSNGTVSLEVALQAMNVPCGSEVIVPAYTFEATAAAVLFSGCKPIFADISKTDYCLDPESVARSLTNNTSAIIPVHLAMNMADMEALVGIAERHDLKILEDCAHAHGARFAGKAAGAWGHAGSFSFQTSKLMTAGEGGAITTSDDALYDRAWALTNCGRKRPGAPKEPDVVGHNYRMSDLQAAVLGCQLDRLDQQHSVRGNNAAQLTSALNELDGLSPLKRDPRLETQAIYQYVFRFSQEELGFKRDTFVAALEAEGIPCDGRFYESLPESELLRVDPKRYPGLVPERDDPANQWPNAHRAAYLESVWLPHQTLLGTPNDTQSVVDAITRVLEHKDTLRAREDEIKQTQARSAR